jgi:hypothetical protein
VSVSFSSRCCPDPLSAGLATLRGPTHPAHREKYADGYLFSVPLLRQPILAAVRRLRRPPASALISSPDP